MKQGLSCSIPAAALLAAASACITVPSNPPPRASPAVGPEAEIREAARFIAAQHVTPVDEQQLLAEAARALGEEARRTADGGAGRDPLTLRAAVDRLRLAPASLPEAEITAIALRAMAASLGDDSRLMEPADLWPQHGPRNGGTASVGLSVGARGGAMRVLRVLPGGPAAAAGIEANLELRSVDGRSTEGITAEQTVALLRGADGSGVDLGLADAGGRIRSVRVVRKPIFLGSVDCRVLGERILYLGVREIGRGTAREAGRLAAASGAGLELAILDLRGSTGGLLDVSRDLADLFIGSGLILSAVGNWPKPDEAYAKLGTSPLEKTRLAVLVDGVTSSGSEAIAAAVQDHRRGTVLGERTAGRATIAVLHEVGRASIKLVIGRLHRPSGEPIDARGVTPDVAVAADAPRPAQPLPDRACPGFASPAPVAADPVVARAAELLLQP